MVKIHPSEITPEHVYLNRRQFLLGAGAALASWALGGCACPQEPEQQPPSGTSAPIESPQAGDLEAELNTFEEITGFNNFYEFSLSKTEVARLAEGFVTSPWDLEVGGLVSTPRTFGLEDILKFEREERIYRMRCVEAWSMVIPWDGFPLRKLLEAVEPTSDAKYVRFETLYDPERMPGQNASVLDWPYVEGLRLDEAMHDLTLLATGLYGKDLLPQNGAPVRLVVPWKYGFKSIKSIVKIDLVAKEPVTTWAAASPTEYGFYANVNPDVSHPRWSQASERRIGESGRRETLLFNGYGEEVAALYEGLDLTKNF
ncbi:MAG: protein-methionine-sulfoxide reductase catalytic subunit MsrP [Anaerolineae bacterium]|nr:protein-methionine-sulfoxide reductase catalytic subunit MsrP [Anaerolineae bacterium]